jgi:mRNA interferase MazF
LAEKPGSRVSTPERGDVVWLSFDPRAGHEQGGHRPVIVLSPALYNRRSGLALFVPITSQIKGYPFEIVLPAGLSVGGAVLTDQVKSLDWRARGLKRIGRLPAEVVDQILKRVALLLMA